jgi:hypothetical protein
MVDLFTKLPGFQKAPAGLERKILRLLPKVLLVGTTVIALPSLIVRCWSVSDAPRPLEKLTELDENLLNVTERSR